LLDLVALQPILNTAIDAVVVMDAGGGIVDWNARAERIFGWRRDEVLGRKLGDTIVPPQLREAHKHGLTRFLATGEAAVLGRVLELSAVRRDQSEFPIELSITAYGEPPSQIFLGFIRDISERREAIARLAVSEARFRAAIDAVQGVLWTNNAAGEMVGEQPGWAALTGQTQAEYQGYGWSKAVHPDDAEPTVQAWNAAVRERRPFVFEHRVRRYDGVWRVFMVRAVPALKDDGAIREWIGVHTDVTERRGAEEQLRESEARFRAMADAAPAPVWMTSAVGGIDFANQAFAEFAGLEREALLGDVWIDLIHPEDIPGVLAQRVTARAGLQPYRFEARFRNDSGAYRWMLASARPRIGGDGQFLGYIGMAMDLTDIKAAELRQRLLINELNHRVKNTLSSVQSIARQTLRADETPAHVRERLVDRLLAMSAAHDILTRESWEGAAIDDIIRQGMRPFTDDRDQERIEIRGPGLRVGPSAALALALAIHELGTNAVKYGALSTPAGKITIAWEPADGAQGVVRWKETDGPAVQAPSRKGFGSRLLDGGLAADLGGKPRLVFAPTGVEAFLPVRFAP
jgi:PAS domain S-box-containing protein